LELEIEKMLTGVANDSIQQVQTNCHGLELQGVTAQWVIGFARPDWIVGCRQLNLDEEGLNKALHLEDVYRLTQDENDSMQCSTGASYLFGWISV
jgi:hypothetical protein